MAGRSGELAHRWAGPITDLYKCTTLYEGADGLPGTNTIYASAGDEPLPGVLGNINDLVDFYMSNWASEPIIATVLAQADVIDSTTGMVTDVNTSGTDTVHTASGTDDPLPPSVQVLLQLRTDLFVNGRRLHGRQFFPYALGAASVEGAVNPSLVSGLRDAANAAYSGTCAVYSPTHHTWATITDCQVWSKFATLRSRRD